MKTLSHFRRIIKFIHLIWDRSHPLAALVMIVSLFMMIICGSSKAPVEVTLFFFGTFVFIGVAYLVAGAAKFYRFTKDMWERSAE